MPDQTPAVERDDRIPVASQSICHGYSIEENLRQMRDFGISITAAEFIAQLIVWEPLR